MENIKLGTDGNLQVLGDAEINGGLTANTVSATNIYNKTEVDEKVNKKQDKLTAGSNITISNNVISAIGGTSGDGFVAKTGDTMTGDLTVEANVNIGSGNTFTSGATTGKYAFAQGFTCVAIGNNAHAEGEYSTAIGLSAHAEGNQTTASGNSSHSEGEGSQAIGISSHAEGLDTQANGDNSHSEGEASQANGNNSHAEGLDTQANGDNSHAEGRGTIAIGDNSHAEGNRTQAIGNNSHANGTYTIAGNENEFVVGRYNVSIRTPLPNANPLFVVGNGTDATNRYNAFEVWGNGNTHINGDAIVAKGLSAETISATTITSPSLDAKQDTLVSGTNIKTINGENLLGSGNIPVNVDTSGMVAKSGSTMTGDLFITDSRLLIGSSSYMVSGGICSMVQGDGNFATGNYSSSTGYGLGATNLAEKAIGSYNVSTYETETDITRLINNANASLFTIGNGDSENNRSNALEVKWNGDVYIWKNGVAKKLQDLF